jgi:hypothetical protein
MEIACESGDPKQPRIAFTVRASYRAAARRQLRVDWITVVRERSVSAVLFLCLFAAQLGLIALSPVLVEVAGDFGVSTAAAGQLRTV